MNRRDVIKEAGAISLAYILPLKITSIHKNKKLYAATRKSHRGIFSATIFYRDDTEVNTVSLP